MCLGIPGQIIAIVDASALTGTVAVAGVRRVVNLALVHDASEPLSALIGAWVLIHVGFAMSLIDEREAKRTLELLHDLGELDATTPPEQVSK
jgi:hydrogenase expression/formation protein HypC